MPNHIYNIITFDCSDEKAQEIYHALEYDDPQAEKGIDFNKIIPMPAALNIECGSYTNQSIELFMTSINPDINHLEGEKMDKRAFAFLCKAVQSQMFSPLKADLTPDEIKKYTKHHSKEEMLKLGETAISNLINYHAITWYEWRIKNWGTKWNSYDNFFDGNTMTFNTAWAAPHPILQKLSEMHPDITIEHQWADENIGNNCGRRTYLGGSIQDEYYPESSKEGIDFACEILGCEVEEYGFILNADESNYILLDDDKLDLVTFRDQPCLFVNDRMTNADIPKGLFCYHVRMSEDGQNYATIEPVVKVNLGASLITNMPLDFEGKDHIELQSGDLNFVGHQITMDEYMQKNFEMEEGMKL